MPKKLLGIRRSFMKSRVFNFIFGWLLVPLWILWPAAWPQVARESSTWPAKDWSQGSIAKAGLDQKILADFAEDLGSGKYGLIDSLDVFRCGKQVFHRTYSHHYGASYAKEAKVRGPLNARLTGPYNYFDPAWHPYYHGSQLHSMQSVSKTVTSIIIGIALTRGDFKSGVDTPVLHYFDVSKVENVDERKKRMTLQNVLTMSTGLEWNEENVPYDDPRSDSSLMEATDDWVQYVIDKPMAEEPGKHFNYSSGATELLAYIFKKETGQDIEEYSKKYLFEPLAIEYYWKRTPLDVIDTEGGLYLRGEDLAKLGYLYLCNGVWNGKRIVSEDWVKQSLTPRLDAEYGMKYGYKWWLYPRKEQGHFVWMCLGFGGQRLMVFPEEQLIVVFTGWQILKDTAPISSLLARVLPAVETQKCSGVPR
jgi:CubicO group peptidase (beta-lactamase class C family)